MWYLFRVNHQDIRMVSLTSLWCVYYDFWTDSAYYSGVSVVDFKQVNAGWVKDFYSRVTKELNKFTLMDEYLSARICSIKWFNVSVCFFCVNCPSIPTNISIGVSSASINCHKHDCSKHDQLKEASTMKNKSFNKLFSRIFKNLQKQLLQQTLQTRSKKIN